VRTAEQPGRLLPALPGKARGVVGVAADERGRNVYTFQCENCFTVETPRITTMMNARFHVAGDDRRRLCEDCRLTVFADCECFQCREERRGD
jgi:hypothetical protein